MTNPQYDDEWGGAPPATMEPAGALVSVGPEQLLMRAVEKGAGIEALERLIALRERIKEAEAREAYFGALAALQADLPTIKKTKTAKVVSKRTGGAYEYRYAPLESIIEQTREHLKRHGFSYQFRTGDEPQALIVTCIAHHLGGHSEDTSIRVPIGTAERMNAAQEVGSAHTYGKRYTFCGVFGIATGDEDDDGSAAAPAGKPRQAKPKGPSENQLKRLHAIKREYGVSDEALREWLTSAGCVDENGRPSTKLLSREQYEELTDRWIPEQAGGEQ